jgi:predicted O-methyltransferase YrrM
VWFLGHAPRWEPLLDELDGREADILEVGSFEGLSASYLLWRLPDARITCIDTFGGGTEHRGTDVDISQLEKRFDANVNLVGGERVRKLVGDSRRKLLDLVDEMVRFDLVYVDGSHLGLDVIIDAALAWQILKPGGTLVFDDYHWAELGEDALLRPGAAIDAFLALVDGKYEIRFHEYQVAVRKTI